MHEAVTTEGPVDFTLAFKRWASNPTARVDPRWRDLPPSPVNWFHNPRYIVLRPKPGLTLPPQYDGLWLDRLQIEGRVSIHPAAATGTATGRYEYREDGMSAEVYEVSW